MIPLPPSAGAESTASALSPPDFHRLGELAAWLAGRQAELAARVAALETRHAALAQRVDRIRGHLRVLTWLAASGTALAAAALLAGAFSLLGFPALPAWLAAWTASPPLPP